MRCAAAVMCLLSIGAAPPLPKPTPDAKLRAIVAQVDAAQLKRTVEELVAFGTRHTLSTQADPHRGIGGALIWAEHRFRNQHLQTFWPCETVTGERIPKPTRVCDMLGIQRGIERPDDVVIIQGHIDSRVT